MASEDTHARARLMAHLDGWLVCDAGVERTRLVVAEAGDAVVLPLHADLADAGGWSYAAPQEMDPAIELALVPEESTDAGEPIDAREIEADRWLAYHGETPPRCRLVALAIDFARFRSNGTTHVAEGAGVLTANPLGAALPALCAQLNFDPDRLRAACDRLAGVAPERPVAVGVDELGVHVRAAFDVLRLAFEEPVADEARARVAIEAMLDG
ncbi:MAG: hypothetical protein AAFX79_09575 [Planctomycetota bacterium]